MKKFNKSFIWVGLILASINILWLAYNYYQYQNIPKWFIDLNAYKLYVHLIFYGLFVSFLSHILVGLSILSYLKNAKNNYLAVAGILILGCVSFIALFFDWAGLCDILNEYAAGYGITLELNIIWLAQIIHLSFFLFSFIFLMISKYTSQAANSKSIYREQLFIILNSIGMVCGLIGLTMVYLFFSFNRSLHLIEIIPFTIILLPYLLIFIYWANRFIRDKKTGLHDEKQRYDLHKSGIVALIVSITMMLLFFILNYKDINGPASSMWLPFYLFMVMAVFSSTALYHYKVH